MDPVSPSLLILYQIFCNFTQLIVYFAKFSEKQIKDKKHRQ